MLSLLEEQKDVRKNVKKNNLPIPVRVDGIIWMFN
jgi:hypothetical protein